MEFLMALERKSNSCTDISTDDELTSSTEYHTVTDDEETITATDYDTVSEDLSFDLKSEDLPSSSSDYRTLSPHTDSEVSPKEESYGKPDYECKVCVRRYRTLQECLRHELLQHTNTQKSPQKSVRSSLSHLLPVFGRNNQQADRARIHELFQKCKLGQELNELFEIYCVSEKKQREIVDAVKTCLFKQIGLAKGIKVYTFGSCENGLMMWDSDIDVHVSMAFPIDGYRKRQYDGNERRVFNRINGCLRQGGLFDEVITVRRARVPIIKCRHLGTGMRIDINCSCPNSVANTAFLSELSHFDERIHSLLRFLKIWAKNMWIVGRNRMTSYCLCMLVVFYLQQPVDHRPSLIPSIKRMQNKTRPKYIQGVNHAFNLHDNMKRLPADLRTSSLIKGFFKFYRNFDFSKEMIALYLGVTVPLDDFRSEKYKYTEYLKQMSAMKEVSNRDEPVEELNVDRVMVVQDPFQLNQNIAKGIGANQLEYFRKCIEYGYHICVNDNLQTDGELYEALLFDIISNMENEARQLSICTGKNTGLMQPHELMYSFSPCRAEIRALTAQQLNAALASGSKPKSTDSIYRLWTRHYIEAIYVILTRIYFFSITLLTENDDPYDERFLQHPTNDLSEETYNRDQIVESLQQFEKANELVWVINGFIDTWSERVFQRENSQTFASFQYALTKKLLEERRKKPAYTVKLLGRFSLKPLENFRMLEIVLKQHQQTRQWFCKKEPMRKFFTNLKCSLQNFSLKEKLQVESGLRYGMSKKFSDDFFWKGVAIERFCNAPITTPPEAKGNNLHESSILSEE